MMQTEAPDMNFSRNKNTSRSPFLAAVLSICGTCLVAQSPNTVTIKYDDGDGITGVLIEATDDSVRIDTLMGAVTIPFQGVSCIGVVCPDAIRLEVATAPVVLSTKDGTATLAGDLIGIEDGQYILATDLGELLIDTDQVRCEGEACPVVETAPVFGGQVVLTTGTTSIEGVLSGLEDDAYIVEVELLGALRVTRDASCAGEGCPQ